MRVLQLGPYPPPHGGVQSNLVAIRTFLRNHDVSCAVINITRHRRPNDDEIYYPENSSQLVQLLFQLKYDILHLHIGGMLTRRLLGLGLVCALMPGTKSVLTFHSGGFPSTPQGKSTGPNSFAGFVLRRFDGLIGVNPEIMEFFGQLGADLKKTKLIYPHSFLSPEQPSLLTEPLASFLAAHDPVLISVGLLEQEYDLPLQIEVLGQVRRNFPSAGLVLIGSGNLEQELRDKIQQQPWAEHILLCGDVAHASTIQAIAQARLMLRTTLYDGDAVSVREALHIGTPVIASDNGMRPPGVHLVPKSDLSALVRAIEKELAHPKLRKESAGDDETNVKRVRDFYGELLNGELSTRLEK